jgi:hypothetical protein
MDPSTNISDCGVAAAKKKIKKTLKTHGAGAPTLV